MNAIKLGCGFALGQALFPLGVVGAIVAAFGLLFVVCRVLDAWDRFKRKRRARKGEKR